jgi:hypothetical protein
MAGIVREQRNIPGHIHTSGETLMLATGVWGRLTTERNRGHLSCTDSLSTPCQRNSARTCRA